MTIKIYEKILFKQILLDKVKNLYYVFYNLKEEPIEVEADNVLDAIIKSNVEKPIKVQRIDTVIKEKSIISKNYLINNN
jgi:hypothetical protein